MLKYITALLLAIICMHSTMAQTVVTGQIIDAQTKEPLQGATIHCTDANCHCGCTTNAAGIFEMHCKDCRQLSVSSLGYAVKQFSIADKNYIVSLVPAESKLETLVVTANRGAGTRRADAPVAIATISNKTLQDAKPATIDQVLNKVSGVNMVNLGNEQHQMSIRQPMTTKSLFLYLEDGIPIRTSGLYNHNALLEINMTAAKSIEVIKGPSSSLYGSEAIGGVVNFISLAPTVLPVLKLSMQGNNVGYKRADLVASASKGKWGFVLSGYDAGKKNGYLAYSDFHKATATARIDYHLSDKSTFTWSTTALRYYSDMAGGVDSIMFASKAFTNQQTFTYRKVDALRSHISWTHQWNEQGKTTVTALFRNNTIEQNPAYRVKDDYRKVNGVYTGNKELAHGEINASSFHSFALIAQHKQNFGWKKSVLVGGINAELSPSTYDAQYIRIKKDTVSRSYTSYQHTDSILTNYATALNNIAGFLNFEFSPLAKLRVVASLRYDYFHYNFNNDLKPSAYSGSPDTANHFARVSPKLGFTYNFSKKAGLYANYSEGFVPPQVTELYTGVQVPSLAPSVFYNYEAGGWLAILQNKLSADVSFYRLRGTNEVISVKLDDGSYANQNAGRTLHKGVELGLNAGFTKEISFRLSGAYSKHQFIDYVEKGASYNGNQMANAPNWLYNAEAWYKPSFAKGLRLGVELQHVGRYFTDPQNTATYKGYNALNCRVGYNFKNFEVWLHVLNATNNYYSYITTKSAFGYSYQVAEPLNVNMGLAYDFGGLLNKKK